MLQFCKNADALKMPALPLKDSPVPNNALVLPDITNLHPIPHPVPVSELCQELVGDTDTSKFTSSATVQHCRPVFCYEPSAATIAKKAATAKNALFKQSDVRGIIKESCKF